MFQSFNLFPHMSVMENVTLAPIKVLKLDTAEAEGTCDDAAEAHRS